MDSPIWRPVSIYPYSSIRHFFKITKLTPRWQKICWKKTFLLLKRVILQSTTGLQMNLSQLAVQETVNKIRTMLLFQKLFSISLFCCLHVLRLSWLKLITFSWGHREWGKCPFLKREGIREVLTLSLSPVGADLTEYFLTWVASWLSQESTIPVRDSSKSKDKSPICKRKSQKSIETWYFSPNSWVTVSIFFFGETYTACNWQFGHT